MSNRNRTSRDGHDRPYPSTNPAVAAHHSNRVATSNQTVRRRGRNKPETNERKVLFENNFTSTFKVQVVNGAHTPTGGRRRASDASVLQLHSGSDSRMAHPGDSTEDFQRSRSEPPRRSRKLSSAAVTQCPPRVEPAPQVAFQAPNFNSGLYYNQEPPMLQQQTYSSSSRYIAPNNHDAIFEEPPRPRRPANYGEHMQYPQAEMTPDSFGPENFAGDLPDEDDFVQAMINELEHWPSVHSERPYGFDI